MLYTETHRLEDQLGDVALAVYQIGDQAQRSLLDLAANVCNPSYLAKAAGQVLSVGREALQNYAPMENRGLMLETLQNNIDVFRLVKDRPLGTPQAGSFPLLDLVAKAYLQQPFPALWIIEGLGHDYADSFSLDNGALRGILTDPPAGRLPASSLTMLHAGIGLSFAQRVLKPATPYGPRETFRRMATQFAGLCAANSRRGYEGAAYESLGLYTRIWRPEMVLPLDRELQNGPPEILGCFWHGVGRALNFLPVYVVPGLLSPWSEVDRAAPHELARLNMRAGLTWAITLVNMRQPRILELLVRRHGADLAADDSFTNGVISTVVMRKDITPNDPYLAAFCEYSPSSSEPELVVRWDAMVRRPCREAVSRIQPALRKSERLGEIFRYQPLADLVERLERVSLAA